MFAMELGIDSPILYLHNINHLNTYRAFKEESRGFSQAFAVHLQKQQGANGANMAPRDPLMQCPSPAKGGKFCLIVQRLKFEARFFPRENATSCKHDTAKRRGVCTRQKEMLQHRHLKPSRGASATVSADEAHSLPLRVPLIWTEEWKSCLDVGEQCGRLSLEKDDGGGQVVVGKWVNFTFVDLEAHGSADCLATFKLGHDNKHATQGPSQPTKGHKTGNKKKNKSIKCGRKKRHRYENKLKSHLNTKKMKSRLSGYQNNMSAVGFGSLNIENWTISRFLLHYIIKIMIQIDNSSGGARG